MGFDDDITIAAHLMLRTYIYGAGDMDDPPDIGGLSRRVQLRLFGLAYHEAFYVGPGDVPVGCRSTERAAHLCRALEYALASNP